MPPRNRNPENPEPQKDRRKLGGGVLKRTVIPPESPEAVRKRDKIAPEFVRRRSNEDTFSSGTAGSTGRKTRRHGSN